MKKRKLRKIIVDSEEYLWFAGNFNCDGDGGTGVKVWKDKKCIYSGVSSQESITPKTIEILIKSVKTK